jgi:hypothetical protein
MPKVPKLNHHVRLHSWYTSRLSYLSWFTLKCWRIPNFEAVIPYYQWLSAHEC